MSIRRGLIVQFKGAVASRSLMVLLAASSFSMLIAGCGDEVKPANTLDPAPDSHAEEIKRIAMPVFYAAGAVFLLVVVVLAIFVVKYRRRDDAERPKQIEGHTAAELTWTIIPAIIMLVVGLWSVPAIIRMERPPQGAPLTRQVLTERTKSNTSLDGTRMRVEVTGHQWWWEYKYPELEGDNGAAIVTANELVIPVDIETQLDIKSADVLHSFWIPRLAGKTDAVPGRQNMLKLKTSEPGTYFGECAEFCGFSHANMRMRVVVLPQGAFEDWVNRQLAVPTKPIEDPNDPAFQGRGLFTSKGCAGCHAVSGYAQGNVGPNLTHFYDRNVFAGAIFETTDENLRKWLRNPQKEKPGSLMALPQALSEDDITNLMAYLKTLKTCDVPNAGLTSQSTCPTPVVSGATPVNK